MSLARVSWLIVVALCAVASLGSFIAGYAGYGAVVGHIGFDRIVAGEDASMETHAYNHHLHHRYFEVNYSEGLVPFDRLFGTFHDGSKDGEARMNARYQRRKAKANAKANA